MFTYSLLGKSLEKQTKTLKYQKEKQVQTSKVLRPEKHDQKIIKYFLYILQNDYEAQ